MANKRGMKTQLGPEHGDIQTSSLGYTEIEPCSSCSSAKRVITKQPLWLFFMWILNQEVRARIKGNDLKCRNKELLN